MEPKNPIVIDGVDVSGCEFYCDKCCSLSNDRNEQLPFVTSCSEYSNCMFKQLARKERECEELKKQVEIFTRQLEKANKEVIKEKEKNATQRQKNEKYKQTLIKIKEICNSVKTHSRNTHPFRR